MRIEPVLNPTTSYVLYDSFDQSLGNMTKYGDNDFMFFPSDLNRALSVTLLRNIIHELDKMNEVR